MSFETPLPPFNASDPHATFLNSSCLDLLLIELVPMAFRLANELSVSPSSSSDRLDDEEEREAVFYRLEMLGYRVGQGLVERFSRDRPRFTDTLDVIKFLCKDLWMLVFRKQIDNLKTNHRFLWFPCGIIRGALASMGINATVQADTSELPGATFQIKTVAVKA
ncbi:MAG: Trafficking protein particle complex subunit 33 [Trichoglossum hirsutum]|nr:MAG: Trafficking protein particle complex subunit 33 [Trichoglossum hirsutum]